VHKMHKHRGAGTRACWTGTPAGPGERSSQSSPNLRQKPTVSTIKNKTHLYEIGFVPSKSPIAQHPAPSTKKLASFRKFVVHPVVPAGVRTLPGPHASSPFCSVKNWLCSVNNRFVSNNNWLCSVQKTYQWAGAGAFACSQKASVSSPITMGGRHAVLGDSPSTPQCLGGATCD